MFLSKKRRRIVSSVLEGEVYDFDDAVYAAYTTQKDLEKILRLKIPLQMFTDYKSILYAIKKFSMTAEKCLMVNIKEFHNIFGAYELTNVDLVSSKNN